MIKQKFRQKERKVKKVLSKGKPFFSYGIVLNYLPNKFEYNRFAVVIGAKSVKNNVHRVFFRRKFYDFSVKYIFQNKNNKFFDFVFVVKKQNKLDKKNIENIKKFQTDLNFLIKKILK